ncbi:oxidoreductase [Planomonospora parontospora subsp. parontospora]|uniref:Oxidoreductase n=1 Tax=Planomonospora parontospora subsp. parontospora TaxID=97194 RepID=A0ABQ4HDB9_9ACTN|nr:NrfD/PsrC family molybdoenzyme membrane anchor subunit [Planomonospora parontospora]GII10108.1 oxidoreductase [Planomonospora parontospora subsp. parontospora]
MTVPHPAQAPLPEAAWGPLLASYVVLVGLPSGVTLTTWWLGRQRLSEAAAIDRYGAWGAMGALALISVLLIFDLGRPERFYSMITRFDNLGSPLAVGAKLIAAKMFLLAVLIYGFERGRRSANAAEPMAAGRKTGSVLAWVVVFISFALAVYPASLLSRSWASPLADSSGSALIFLITALLMGAAAVLLTVSVLGTVPGTRELLHAGRRALLLLLGCFAVTLLFEMLSLAGRAPDRLLAGEVLTGGSAAMFWGVVVAGGIAVPAVGLLFFRTHRKAVFVSAVAVLAGAAATRYLLFAVGQ